MTLNTIRKLNSFKFFNLYSFATRRDGEDPECFKLRLFYLAKI